MHPRRQRREPARGRRIVQNNRTRLRNRARTARDAKRVVVDARAVELGLDLELRPEVRRELRPERRIAVAVPPDSFDKEKILVKKIPAAILREYNLL